MKCKLLAIALLLAAYQSANAAGVFDGSSDLVYVQSAGPIDYPVLITAYIDPNNTSQRGTIVALTDNGAGGSLDGIVLEVRGDEADDLIQATAYEAGVSSSATTVYDAITTGDRRFVMVLFESPTSRHIRDHDPEDPEEPENDIPWIGPPVLREDATGITPGNWTHLSIGSLHNGGATNHFNGQISHVGIWFDVPASTTKIRAVTSAIVNKPTHHWMLRPWLYLHQTLKRKENDYPDWGPTVTNNGVTFNFADLPL